MPILTRAVLLVAFAMLGVGAAKANIGDDITHLRAAYGSAQAVGDQMLFQHDGYSICVYFDGDKSGMEIFVRDGSIKDKPDLTQDDIDQILVAEGDGHTWSAIQTRNGKPTWMRDDSRLIARFSPGEKILAIMVNSK